MTLVTGEAAFNGIPGRYEILLGDDSYERRITIDGVQLWDAFDGESFWQSDFGSPVYRRSSPFSANEGLSWLQVLRQFNGPGSSSPAEWTIESPFGNTAISMSEGRLKSQTSGGNRTEYGPIESKSDSSESLRPQDKPRLNCTLEFDLQIGLPRARIMVGGHSVFVLIDSGSDHSLFDESLASTVLAPIVSVGVPGQQMQEKVGIIEDLHLGDAVIEQSVAFLTNFKSMPGPFRMLKGIIGQDILARGIVHFDHKAKRLHLSDHSNSPLSWPLDGSYTKAVLNGEEGWFRIDSGSQFTIHKFVKNLATTSDANAHVGIGGRVRTKPARFSKLVLGNASFTNINGFEEQDESGLAGNIGLKLLEAMDITLDFATGLASFENLSNS